MDEEKIKSILETLQGITYLEWKKLKSTIDKHFENEVAIQGNKIHMATPKDIIDLYKKLF